MAAQSALDLLRQLLMTCRAYASIPVGDAEAGGRQLAVPHLLAGSFAFLCLLFAVSKPCLAKRPAVLRGGGTWRGGAGRNGAEYVAWCVRGCQTQLPSQHTLFTAPCCCCRYEDCGGDAVCRSAACAGAAVQAAACGQPRSCHCNNAAGEWLTSPLSLLLVLVTSWSNSGCHVAASQHPTSLHCFRQALTATATQEAAEAGSLVVISVVLLSCAG